MDFMGDASGGPVGLEVQVAPPVSGWASSERVGRPSDQMFCAMACR